MSFKPADYQCFRFLSWAYDESACRARFDYTLDDAHHFSETLHFPGATTTFNQNQKEALEQVLAMLHLIIGISYYKTAMPKQIQIDTSVSISAQQAEFLQHFYQQGLGEFAYQNQVDLPRVRFPVQHTLTKTNAYTLPKGTVVPLGGGKDSLVSLRTLEQTGRAFRLFSVGKSALIQSVAKHSAVEHIRVERQLSPHLFKLNQQGALNGHVPITGIIAHILAAAAILYGFDSVVMSNERSASQGNLDYQGIEINHQYSKSLAFERALDQQFQQLLPGLRYFSLLRPLSELGIARLFAQQAQAYFSVFSSCNRNFKILADSPTSRWCLDCPKCRFVFLALAPFLPKRELLDMFGKNLLDDAEQQAGFDALIGYRAHKPFECVGELEESIAAFWQLSQNKAWKEDLLVKRFAAEIVPQWQQTAGDLDQLWQNSLAASDEHNIPVDFSSELALISVA